MTTVADPTTPHKPPKAFRSVLYDDPGVLARVDGRVVFFGDDGTISELECDQFNFIVVLGEIGLSETQALLDRMPGGAPAIACSRRQEVA